MCLSLESWVTTHYLTASNICVVHRACSLLTASIQVHMAASIIRSLPPPFLAHGRKPLLRTFHKLPVFGIRESQGRSAVVAKASGESSEPSTSLSVIESVQNVWDKSEDRVAVVGLGFAAIVALWASVNLIGAIDKLPLIPSTLEFIGILFSSWFIYRYLLFKPNREELFQIVNKSISNILGQ